MPVHQPVERVEPAAVAALGKSPSKCLIPSTVHGRAVQLHADQCLLAAGRLTGTVVVADRFRPDRARRKLVALPGGGRRTRQHLEQKVGRVVAGLALQTLQPQELDRLGGCADEPGPPTGQQYEAVELVQQLLRRLVDAAQDGRAGAGQRLHHLDQLARTVRV